LVDSGARRDDPDGDRNNGLGPAGGTRDSRRGPKVALDTIVEACPIKRCANQSIVVRPEIAGVVTRISGDAKQVEKGSSLFNLDDSMDRAQLAQAEATCCLSATTSARRS
jgi:membrane fusion protein (multidrug efflux system)